MRPCPYCAEPVALHSDCAAACRCCGLTLDVSGRLWLSPETFRPSGFSEEAASRLLSLNDYGHFWAVERRRLIGRVLHRLSRGRVWDAALELGCGSGGMLAMLESLAVSVAAVDGHAKLLREALTASSRTVLIQADVVRPLSGLPQSDLIIALDVLEHVDDDAFLRAIRSTARDDAVLLLSVPAFPFLWSAMDVRAGHRVRYTRKTLSAALARNGWRPLGFTHYQFLLFPVVCASRMIASLLPQEFEQRPGLLANMIFGAVNRLEVALLSGISLPFGSSLLIWAKKEAA